MAMATTALVRDLEVLHDRLQVAPTPRVARRVRALIHEALGLLTETPPPQTPTHTVRVPLGPERLARYAPEPELLSAKEAAATFADTRRRGRKLAASAYESVGAVLSP